MTFDNCRNSLIMRIMGLVMKHIYDSSIVSLFQSIVEALKELEKRNEIECIYTVITYMAITGKIPDKNEFLNAVKKLESIDKEKIMPTLVEHLQPELLDLARKQFFRQEFEKASEELRPKFIQEGRQEERIKMAKVFLSKGVSVDIIAEATELSEKEIKKLAKR